MFKVSNKNTTSFWCFYCQLWTYFTPFSSVSVVDFKQVNVSWVNLKLEPCELKECLYYTSFFIFFLVQKYCHVVHLQSNIDYRRLGMLALFWWC